MTQIGSVAEDYFNSEDVQNIGSDHDKTLVVWNDEFERNFIELL
ncbi:hypothetical protein [uncultured Photobacterium sp.]|nr:hypothetical protein [uncultured Photobacterium sp.]